MKLKIWSEECKSETNNEQLFVKLEVDKDEDILLCACDKHGKTIDNGSILMLEQQLKIVIACSGISDEVPLKTGLMNKLIVVDQEEVKDLYDQVRKYRAEQQLKEKLKEMLSKD